MIRVRVRLYGELRHAGSLENREAAREVAVRDSARIAEVIGALGLPILRVWLVVRRGERLTDDCQLADGDEIDLVPAVGGGSQSVQPTGRFPVDSWNGMPIGNLIAN